MPEPVETFTPAQRPASVFQLAWFRAGVGAIAWVASYLWFEPAWELGLLWLGVLVHVPLALGLVASDSAPRHGRGATLRLASWLAVPGGILLVVAYQPEVDVFWFSVPWLVVCAAAALGGLLRVASLGVRRPAVFADVGLLWLGGHGLWVAIDLAGWNAFGFPPVIVQLAAVHMLYAGFILNVVFARIVATRPARVPAIAGVGSVFGYFAVAAAITLNYLAGWRFLEFPAVCLYGSSVIVMGWMQLFLAFWPRSGLPLASRVLLVISDLSLGTAVTLAFIFAWGTQRGLPTLTIPQMITWHGTLNVFGFGLCGLAGWLIAASRSGPRSYERGPAGGQATRR